MTPEQITREFPYPIASVYADLDDPAQSPQVRKEALYFTCYQLMRTVGLTLIGQYLSGELSPGASKRAMDKLNKSISRIQSPYFKSWIDLLRTLDGQIMSV